MRKRLFETNLTSLPHSCRTAAEHWKSCRTTRTPSPSATSLSDIVTSYIKRYREPAAAEADFYASLPTRAMAVDWAGMARRPDGLRHDHQRRIRVLVLEEVVRRLHAANLSARTFDGLHTTINTAIGGIRGVGDLLVYDTSLRVGARLGLQPEFVYLHAGTRIGARAIGLPTESGSLAPSRLPRAFRRLSPREIEDCLCIYKDEIAGNRSPKPRSDLPLGLDPVRT